MFTACALLNKQKQVVARKIKTRGEVLKVCISDSFKNFARAIKSKNRCNLSLSSTLKLAVCQRTSFSTRFVITLEAVC